MAFFQCAVRPASARRLRLLLPRQLRVRTASYFLSKKLLNGALDFEFVRIAVYLKHVFVVFLLKKGGFLTDENRVDDLINIFHITICS